ncbi:Enoyl-CoA hydratase EchA7 [Mycobacterium tuberculosis]|nr:Enoyl-CoA hydratase EchA7 [Mycobacterium tuberculosis]
MDSPVDYAGPAACGGPFARLTLNSPHNRNALSSTLVSQLHQGLSAAEADPAVRLVVLGHTGGTFCAARTSARPAVVVVIRTGWRWRGRGK